MKKLIDQPKIPKEIAISYIEDTLRDKIYTDQRSKDNKWREIALKELEIIIDSIR